MLRTRTGRWIYENKIFQTQLGRYIYELRRWTEDTGLAPAQTTQNLSTEKGK